MIPVIVYTDELPLIEAYWGGTHWWNLSNAQVREALEYILERKLTSCATMREV